MDDLYFGRKPDGWQGTDELISLKKAIQSQSQREADTALSIAQLMDLQGDTPEAFKTMREYMSLAAGNSDEYFLEMASLQQKLGYPKAASDTLMQIVDMSANLKTFLVTIDSLEKTGRYSDLDRLRFRWLSCCSKDLPLSSYFLQESELITRPEVELFYDRRDKVAWSIEQTSPEVRYQIAKNDISKAPKAKRAAMQSLMLFAPSLLLTDDTRRILQTFLGPFALDAVYRKDAAEVSKWLEAAALMEPGQIQIPIDIIPEADKHFDRATVDVWFDLFWNRMNDQISEFPNDAMSLNNVAWMASQCNRRLDEAVVLARRAVDLRPEPTYMDTLADLEFRLGNVERAIELSQRCRQIEPREEQHRKQLRRFFSSLEVQR